MDTEKKIEEAIARLTELSVNAETLPDAAMKWSQSAVNLANTLAKLVEIRLAEGK